MSTVTASASPAELEASRTIQAPERLVSLDVFRGLTIAGMILVNDPGSWQHIYTPLEHAEWNGWTHTDLVFPFFLFIAGVSMVFSFQSRLAKGATRRDLLLHTLKRGALIILIGIVLHAFPFTPSKFPHLRYFGVLQRIGLVYAIGGAIYLYSSRMGRVAIIVAALLGYWMLLRFVPVPGIGSGNFTPEGNLGAYIDRAVQYGHLYRVTWDPEGLLSNIPAIGTILLGSLVGELLSSQSTWRNKVTWLVAGGVAGIVLGEVVGLGFPINKNLWSSSYVLFTAGYAMLVLTVCYWLIDVKKWLGWTMPFLVFGMNSILAYAVASLFAKVMEMISVGNESLWGWLYNGWFAPYAADPRNASLAFAICFVAMNWLVMLVFYKKKIFLKV